MIINILSLSAMHLILGLLLFLLPTLLWLIALIDILKSNFKESTSKIIWVLIVIFLPIIGSILYFIIGKENKV